MSHVHAQLLVVTRVTFACDSYVGVVYAGQSIQLNVT